MKKNVKLKVLDGGKSNGSITRGTNGNNRRSNKNIEEHYSSSNSYHEKEMKTMENITEIYNEENFKKLVRLAKVQRSYIVKLETGFDMLKHFIKINEDVDDSRSISMQAYREITDELKMPFEYGQSYRYSYE